MLCVMHCSESHVTVWEEIFVDEELRHAPRKFEVEDAQVCISMNLFFFFFSSNRLE